MNRKSLKHLLSTIHKLFFLLFSLSFFVVLSQENISIQFKDFHTAKVTASVVSQENNFFISGDESGKILLYDSDKLLFKKTLRNASGIPIDQIKLLRNDSVVVFTEKAMYQNGERDSIFAMRISDRKIVFKSPLLKDGVKHEFLIEKQDDVIISCSTDYNIYELNILDKNFQPVAQVYPTYLVKVVAFHSNESILAYVKSDMVEQKSILLVNVKTNEIVSEFPIPKNEHIVHLFFEPTTKDLFSISINEKEEKLKVFDLSIDSLINAPVFITEFRGTRFIDISVYNNKDDDSYHMSLTNSSELLGRPSLLISKKDNHFEAEYVNHRNGVNHSTFIEKNEILFFEARNKHQTPIKKFFVYDYKQKIQSRLFPEISTSPFRALFLPYGNWMVWGQNEGSYHSYDPYKAIEYRVKYYESGTFKNRFEKLGLLGYIESKHHVVIQSKYDFFLDKEYGYYIFYGYEKGHNNQNLYGFYKYDFIQDKIIKIHGDDRRRDILDYNDNSKALLLSSKRYTNSGSNPPQKIFLLKKKKYKQLEGEYKFAKFSHNGNYIFLIDDNNLASIVSSNTLKPIYQLELVNGRYEIFSAEIDREQNFIINNSYRTINLNKKCNNESIYFYIDEKNDLVTHERIPCSIINDLSFGKDKIAMIVNKKVLVINDKKMVFPDSDFPEYVSLNSEADKVMLSFNNGRIKIYDANTMTLLGEMLHPDRKSHIYLGKEDVYFSNINPESYLIAKRNDQEISLQTLGESFFNPERILPIFGEPNEQYLSVLKKTIELRGRKLQSSDKGYDKSVIAKSRNSKTSDLYLLSIGVSDYKESQYNLTFADKDAIDMSLVYGEMDQELTDKYNTMFFGKTFDLYDEKGYRSSIKKYYESAIIDNFYALNPDRTIWLNSNIGDEFYLFNFNDQSTKKIIFPETNFSLSHFPEKRLFINPNSSGFYIKDKNSNYYHYNFKEETFYKIDLNFMVFHANNLTPLTEDRWFYYSDGYETKGYKGKFHFGDLKTKQIKTKIVDLNIVDIIDNNVRKTTTLDVVSSTFKTISNNGIHAFYTISSNLFYINLSNQNARPLQIPLDKKVEYDTKVFVSNEGQTFSLVKGVKGESFSIETYDLKGQLMNKREVINKENLIGLSFYNNSPKWVINKESLISKGILNDLMVMANYKAHSFRNVKIKTIINEEANSKSIKDQLDTFFKNAKPNDQVMLFLAGHGVLDKNLTYYFAPHDMDFVDIKANGVSFNSIIESLKDSPSVNKLLLMDTCHAGNTYDVDENEQFKIQVQKKKKRRGGKLVSGDKKKNFKVSDVIYLFDDFLSNSGVSILSASSGKDVAYESKEIENGAFTAAYIKTLRSYLGFYSAIVDSKVARSIPLDENIIEEIMKNVMINTQGKQMPDLKEFNNKADIKIW